MESYHPAAAELTCERFGILQARGQDHPAYTLLRFVWEENFGSIK